MADQIISGVFPTLLLARKTPFGRRQSLFAKRWLCAGIHQPQQAQEPFKTKPAALHVNRHRQMKSVQIMTRKQHEAVLRMVNRHWRNRYERLESEKQHASTEVVWHTSKQMAARLQVSVRTIAYWTSDGILPSYKKGRLVRYDLEECLQALKAFRRKSQFENTNGPE